MQKHVYLTSRSRLPTKTERPNLLFLTCSHATIHTRKKNYFPFSILKTQNPETFCFPGVHEKSTNI